MRSQVTFCSILLVLFVITAGSKTQAQCNSAFNLWADANIPATASVYQNYNNHADGLYIWNWGDGSPNDTTYNSNFNYPTITHDYVATGSYTICLNYQSVIGACNTSTCWGFTVTTTTLPPKSIAFVSAGDSSWVGFCPTMPVTAGFYIQAVVMGYTPSDSIHAKVFFGDGIDTLFKMSPNYTGGAGQVSAYFTHTYTSGGLYSVQYIVSDNAGTTADTVTKYNELDLQDSCGNLNGYVYVDVNGNCQFDSGDSILSNIWLNITSSTGATHWAWADTLGYYSVAVPLANTYTLSVPYLSYYGYTYACGGAGLSGIAIPNSVDIGVVCPAGFDLSGYMWGWRFRPGDSAWVMAWANNFSCIPQSGTVTLTLDPNTTFMSEVYGNPVSVSGNQVSWSFTNLTSMNNWWGWSGTNTQYNRYLKLNCSTNLQIGDSVCYTLDVSPVSGDVDPSNNTLNKCFPVQNSWDPNFKEVYPRGVGAQGFVAQNTEFTYTIHFQNTGNAQAYNIAILDTMDTDLDMSTFQIIAASHYVEPHLVGNNGIKFQFNNIMLPDSASDPEGSQGWVTYKIKAKPGQPGGTQYTNTAYIYFDFNPAIITNTTLNTIELSVVGIAQQKIEANNLSVAPNPVSDFTQLTLSSKEHGIVTIKVIDMLGQLVSSEEKALNKGKNIFNVETSFLAKGIYLLHLETGGKALGSVKIVK